MAESNCQDLVDSYLAWLRNNFQPIEADHARRISTPFLDRHNDALEIFVEKKGEQTILTDGGETISDLRSSGMDFNTPKRKEILDAILNGFGVRLGNGERLFVATASPADLGQKKHNLLQAMLAVGDMFVMSQEHVLSFFKEDVALFLQENNLAHMTEFKLSGKSGFDHKFDFGLPKTRLQPERVLQAMNRLTRDNTTSLAWAVSDVRLTRHEPMKAFAFINDEVESPNPEFIDALTAYDIGTLSWRERQSAIPSLNGS